MKSNSKQPKKYYEIIINNGSINQNIKILTDDTPEQFFAKIKSGEYLTSICNNQVIEIPSFKVVGEIEGQGVLDDTEFDFESMEGLVQ